jgi:hypothetical protein
VSGRAKVEFLGLAENAMQLPPRLKSNPKKLLLNCFRHDGEALQDFPLATDVLAFIRLIYLTDQNDVISGVDNKVTDAAAWLHRE